MKTRLLLIACLSIIFLSACQFSQNISNITPTTSPVVTNTSDREVFSTSTPSKATQILANESSYLLLQDLLKDNAGCKLPCWWGVIPGQSTPLVFHEALSPLENITNTRLLFANSGSAEILYPQNDWLLSIVLSFEADDIDKFVRLIIVRTQAFHAKEDMNEKYRYGATEYHQLLGMYSLSKILSVYGPPSQVLIRADIYNYTQSPDTFKTTLLYPEKGIFVRYNSLAEKFGEKVRGCPSMAFVEMWLLSPEESNNFQVILSEKDMTWEGNFSYSKKLEESTLLSLEEFYQIFRKPTDNCLETDLNIWPEH